MTRTVGETRRSTVADETVAAFVPNRLPPANLGILHETTGRKRDRTYGYARYLELLRAGTELASPRRRTATGGATDEERPWRSTGRRSTR